MGFLAGWNPVENMRFRETELNFKVADAQEEELVRDDTKQFTYPPLKKTLGTFSLTVENGSFNDSEICVMLGENGTGKTTFIKMLAGLLKPDDGSKVPKINVIQTPENLTKVPGHRSSAV